MLFNENIMKEMIVARPRPEFTDEMYIILAEMVAKEYLNITEPNEDEIDCIAAIIEDYGAEDGFQIGKEMEREGFDIDANIVANLDCIYNDKQDMLYDEIEKWVISDNILPKYSVGNKILCEVFGKETEGEIVKINKKQAYYNVKTATSKENSSYVINFEDVKPI